MRLLFLFQIIALLFVALSLAAKSSCGTGGSVTGEFLVLILLLGLIEP